MQSTTFADMASIGSIHKIEPMREYKGVRSLWFEVVATGTWWFWVVQNPQRTLSGEKCFLCRSGVVYDLHGADVKIYAIEPAGPVGFVIFTCNIIHEG